MSRPFRPGLSALLVSVKASGPGLAVIDLTRKGHKRPDLVAAGLDVFLDCELPAHSLDAATQHHHGLGASLQERRDVLTEVLDAALDFLADVVGMQTNSAPDALHCGLALHLLV